MVLAPFFGAGVLTGSMKWSLIASIAFFLSGVLIFRHPKRKLPPLTPEELNALAAADEAPGVPSVRRLTPEELSTLVDSPVKSPTLTGNVLEFWQRHKRAFMGIGLVIGAVILMAFGIGIHNVLASASTHFSALTHLAHLTAAPAQAIQSTAPHAVATITHAITSTPPPMTPHAAHIARQTVQLAFDDATKTLTIGKGNTVSGIAQWAVQKGLLHGHLYGHGAAVDQVWEIIKSQNLDHAHATWDVDHIYVADKLDMSALFKNAPAAVSQLSNVPAQGVIAGSSVFGPQVATAGLFLPLVGLFAIPFGRRARFRPLLYLGRGA